MNGECALITPISTSIAQRITSGYRALIKSSTQRRAVYSSASLIVIQDITRLRSRRRIKSKPRSPFGTYVYKTISFGLKNAGATYQRAIQMCFADQLHRNVEAYVDDVVIKTRHPDDLIVDFKETFSSLRKFRWKLNPTKCVFGVSSGKLLGFIVSNRGIEANPVKIMAITDMGAPTTIKDV
jgi:hypothetical protein